MTYFFVITLLCDIADDTHRPGIGRSSLRVAFITVRPCSPKFSNLRHYFCCYRFISLTITGYIGAKFRYYQQAAIGTAATIARFFADEIIG